MAFNTLRLRPELLASVASLNYTTMTPIQMSVLPDILDKADVIAQAETGSGKTAAFALGLLNKLDIHAYTTQALVLCPTRELSDQVAAETRRLASAMANTKVLTLCGGRPMQAQLASLKRAPHIVVGTPGRILKHLEKETLQLDHVATLVLDEADRMLDMGFQDDIMKILSATKASRQTLLFSATFPAQIKQISSSIQSNPVEVRIEQARAQEQIQQIFHNVIQERKIPALLTLLDLHQPDSCIVFCNRKQQCRDTAEALRKHGHSVKALHGDLDQSERDEAMIQFDNGSVSILVATDVAARGLDISALSAVFNFDMAQDPETHVHRIGRTGRAGNSGLAISLALPDEHHRILALEDYIVATVTQEPLDITDTGYLTPTSAKNQTLHVRGGKKDKLRPGDIVGALTACKTLSKDDIGKITVLDKHTYVAIARNLTGDALKILSNDKIKGRRFKVRKLQ